MELDFEKSLTYISKDPGWANKLLAGSGISLAAVIVFIIPLFTYLFYFLPSFLFSVIFLLSLIYVTANHSSLHPTAFIFLALLGAFTLLLYLLTCIFCPLMVANFFKDLKILSFINFKDAFGLLKGNVGNYCILILLFLALSVMIQVVFSLLLITIVGLIFLPVLYFYVYLVSAELTAQFVLCAKEKQQDSQAE